METKLSTGAKVGYLALGLFLAVVGVGIAWFINKDKPTSKEALKFSIIGLVIAIVVYVLFYVLVFATAMSHVAGM